MQMTYRKLLGLHQALSGLGEGITEKVVEVMNGGKVTNRVIQMPYRLGTARLSIAVNLNAMEPVVKHFNDERRKLFEQFAGKGVTQMDEKSPSAKKFVKASEELLDTETGVDLVMLTAADLHLDENEIPGTLISALVPILSDMQSAGTTPETGVKVARRRRGRTSR